MRGIADFKIAQDFRVSLEISLDVYKIALSCRPLVTWRCLICLDNVYHNLYSTILTLSMHVSATWNSSGTEHKTKLIELIVMGYPSQGKHLQITLA